MEIQSALLQAHRTYPRKPVMVLEFGHWADDAADVAQQVRVFNTYYGQLSQNFDTEQGGFVGAAVWWSLDDYWTQRHGITVETFGLYSPDGKPRPVGAAAARSFASSAPPTPPTSVRTGGVAVAIQPGERHALLVPYLVYAFALPAVMLIFAIFVLTRVRRRPAW